MHHQSDIDFAVFMATRSWPRVRAERFVEAPRTTLRHNYDNATHNHLVLMRAQQKGN